MSGLQIPGRLPFQVSWHPGPNAHPCASVIPLANGIHLAIVGGMSSLETVAAQIMVHRGCSAEQAADMAAELIDACETLRLERAMEQAARAAAERLAQEQEAEAARKNGESKLILT